MPEEILGYEYKFSMHIPYKVNGDDWIIVKENIHYKDGTIKPNLRFVKNFKRPFYITKKDFRDYEDKKEYEKLSMVDKYEVTQCDLNREILIKLGQDVRFLKYIPKLKEICQSPYVYGADISVTSILNHDYKVKFPDLTTPYSVCALDIETNVFKKSGNDQDILLISLVMEDIFTKRLKVHVSVNKFFILDLINGKEYEDVKKDIIESINKYINDYVKDADIEIDICEEEVACIYKTFEKANLWMPDFLAVWNINFDLPKIVSVLEKNIIDPANVFSHPKVPKELRYFKYIEGPSRHRKADGQVHSISPANRWHMTYSTSSFHFIDAMCVYKLNRLALPEEQSYSLDNILNKELGIRKLKFKEADGASGLQWHELMQTKYKKEYIAYNIFDSLSMIELDKKTNDLSLSIGVFCEYTDFNSFKSQPKRLIDKLHFVALENDSVIGSSSNEIKQDIDEKTLSLQNWIVSLPPHLLVDNGINLIKENESVRSTARVFVGDCDIAGAYPSSQVALNISKETTMTEIIDIKNVDKEFFKIQNMNMLMGKVNAVDYCSNMFEFPSLQSLKDYF